jgi:hypothetical protein
MVTLESAEGFARGNRDVCEFSDKCPNYTPSCHVCNTNERLTYNHGHPVSCYQDMVNAEEQK